VRYVVFVVLAVVPMGLIGWMVWQGRTAPPAMALAAPGEGSGHKGPGGPGRPNAADAPLSALFEGAIEGAKVKDKVTFFHGQELFDAIDGAAPLFIERQFRTLARADMAMSDGAELTCDVYDMTEPENAASIFFAEKSATSKQVEDWPQAIMAQGSFIFRSGAYYVKLTAFDKKAEGALPAVARALRERTR
jgi:hypothetical protein